MGGSVVKSQSDEEVAGFTGQVLHCTGEASCLLFCVKSKEKSIKKAVVGDYENDFY